MKAKTKRICALFVAVVLVITTAFFYAPVSFAETTETDLTEQTASETDAVLETTEKTAEEVQSEKELSKQLENGELEYQILSDTDKILLFQKLFSEEKTWFVELFRTDTATLLRVFDESSVVDFQEELTRLLLENQKSFVLEYLTNAELETVFGMSGEVCRAYYEDVATGSDVEPTAVSETASETDAEDVVPDVSTEANTEEAIITESDTEEITTEATTEADAEPEEREFVFDLAGFRFLASAFDNLIENGIVVFNNGPGVTYTMGGHSVTCIQQSGHALGYDSTDGRYVYCIEHSDNSPFGYEPSVTNSRYYIEGAGDGNYSGQGLALRNAFFSYYLGADPNASEPTAKALGSSSRLNTQGTTLNNYYISSGTNAFTGPFPDSHMFGMQDTAGNMIASRDVTGSQIQVTYDSANNVLKSDVYILKTGTENYSAAGVSHNNCIQHKLTVPAGVTLYYSSNGGASYRSMTGAGTIYLNGNERIYFTVPEGFTGTATVRSESWAPSVNTRGYYIGGITYFRTLGGYSVDQQMVSVGSSTVEISFIIVPEEQGSVSMSMKKQTLASMEDCVAGNSCYSLAGAVYGVYDSYSAAQAATNDNRGSYKYLLTTDANGNSNVVNDVPVGTYYAKEVLASPGYALDSNIYTVNVTSANTTGNPATFTSYEIPKLDPLSIFLTKKNDVGTPIANAQYTVKFYKGVKMNTDPALSNVPVDKSWVFKTDASGTIRFHYDSRWFVRGDAFYYNAANTPSLPEGTVTIQETYAPEGFVLDSTLYVRQITPGENTSISTFNAVNVTEETVRGDVAFKKKDENGNALANVKFSITDANGETHIVWTDANGYYSTASSHILHSKNTNSGDAGDGVWFGAAVVSDNQGALPFGTYTIKELRCEANKDTYKDIAPITFSITTNGQVYEIGDIINYKFPTITTTAKDSISGTNIATIGEKLHGVDTVHANGLEIGHEYKLLCKVWSKVHGAFLDISGTREFTATSETMDIDVEFDLDITVDFLGEDIVCCEYLTDSYYPDEIIAMHEDISCEEQTIHFPAPELHTTAKDAVSLTHEGKRRHDSVIIDTVDIKHIIPGCTYKLCGTVMSYDDKAEFVTASGDTVTAEVIFTAKESAISVDVVFPAIDTMDLFGKSLVCYEQLYMLVDDKEYLIASHEDIESKGQTVTYDDIVGYAEMHFNQTTGGGGARIKFGPETADFSHPWMILFVTVSSGICIIYVVRKRKKEEQHHEK